MESLLKRIERNRREHDRLIALILCLSLIVSMGTFAVFHKKAVAKTYIRQVLDCPLATEGAGLVVHTHNDDCFDENHNLVCTLPELEAHTHGDACYTEVPVQVCGLAESVGHVHGSDCRALMLTCEEEERETTFDEEGNVADPGHVHTPDCYSEVLSCGMEEGDGAHTHTDACYTTEYVLVCDKPEIRLHVHTDDCYQKNEDGSIYVDENGYSWLICGLPEVVQHAHGPECFTAYELDDGEPEEADEIVAADEIAAEPAEDTDTAESIDEEKTDAEESGDKENTELTEAKETTDTEDIPMPAVLMPAQSWERTAGGIKVSVEAPEGAFPENTRIAVTPVNGNRLKDTVADAVEGEVLEVQAVDITFFDADGHEIEPVIPIRVVMTPAATEHAEEKTNVVHVDIMQQTAELIEQAEGTEADNTEVVFDAEAFTIYAIVYTVDFEYGVNGKLFNSSMPGAEDMPLSEIVKGLGIVSEEELETFLSKIASVTSTNEEVAVVTEDRSVRVLKDGDAQIVITMQDGAAFSIDVSAEGETSVEAENVAVSTVNDLYLPASSEVKAELLTEEQGGSAIAAVQRAEETQGAYQAFSIALENVDVTGYDGFKVSVTLPEDTVVGKDFQLYQIREDETVNLTESLEVTGEENENGLQNVSGFSFRTDDFADFVLSYSIETNYTAFDGKTFKISLNYGPEAQIPDGAELKVEEILPETEVYAQYLNDSVTELGVKSRAVSFARFFDIEIQKDGEKIEPKAPVSVKIEMMNLPEETENAAAQVIHFGEQTEVLSAEAVGTDVSFETGSFSVYGVVYTVDFHYEINGQTFEFSIPGGGFISLEHLIEALGIRVGDADDINNITDGAVEEESAETAVEEIEAAWAAEPEAADDDENGKVDAAAAYEQAINLNRIPVSEETRAFVEDIETVEFSSPELAWVGKVNEAATVGGLKDANELEIEYSANLTEEQIAEINAQTVEAGDWALISVRPFLSEESLTVTMNNGDSFTIRVTDGQIRKTVIDARGDTWEITVTYGDDARIPDDAELKVEEILPENEAYQDYYHKSMKKAGVTAPAEDGVKVEKDSSDEMLPENAEAEDSITETNVTEAPEETKKSPKKVTSDYIRMFDIKILADEQEIEPSAPVAVRIRLLDAPEDTKAVPQVIHFAKDGDALMELKDRAANSACDSLLFTTNEFSVYSVVYTVDFSYEIDGKVYEFSLPGGGFISLEHLFEVLGIANRDAGSDDVALNHDVDGESLKADAETAIGETEEALGAEGTPVSAGSENEAANTGISTAYKQTIQLNNIPVSEATRAFVADVENVEFSSPELVWVGKVEEDSTVAALKEANGLEVKYSAELTEEQIAEINAQTAEAGDWALISIQPFVSEETLTVTMSTGEVFVIKVTDANFASTVDGKTFALIVANSAKTSGFALESTIRDDKRFTSRQTNINYLGETVNEEVYFCENVDSIKWTFEFIKGSDNQFKLKANNGQYLHYEEGQGFSLSDDPTILYADVTPGDNDHVRLCIDEGLQNAINLYGGNNGFGIWGSGNNDPNELFTLCKPFNMSSSTPGTISTVDNNAEGIELKLFDYDYISTPGTTGDLDKDGNKVNNHYNSSVNQGKKFWFLGWGADSNETDPRINDFTGLGSKIRALQGVVQNNLGTDGYPVLAVDQDGNTTNDSLNYLFNETANDTKSYTANHLFEKIGDKYSYDSNKHYAEFNKYTGNFTVYDGTLEQNSGSDKQWAKNDKAVGFFPFDSYADMKGLYDNNRLYLNPNVSENDQKKSNGQHYRMNHHNGMSLDTHFRLPEGGKDSYGNDIEFEFSGDDDLWVFIDDVLVLDIGGVHQPLNGSINFTTGEVKVDAAIAAKGTSADHIAGTGTTIEEMFRKAGKEYDPNKLHEMKVYWIERGGCDSNCKIEFNLPLTTDKEAGNITFDKVSEVEPSLKLEGAVFTLYKDAECTQPYTIGNVPVTATSDKNGNVNFYAIPPGSYYIKETTFPEGYQAKNPEEIFSVTVVKDTTAKPMKDNEDIDKVTNVPKKITVEVEKKWENGAAPQDASVEITLGRYKLVEDPNAQGSGILVIKDSYTGLPAGKDYHVTYTITPAIKVFLIA